MNSITDKDKCTGCGACLAICSRNAIALKPNEEGFLYPEIEASLCIECHLCEKTCPVNCGVNTCAEMASYACYNCDSEIARKSSSGGVFTAFAEIILDEGGYVFGTEFDEYLNVQMNHTNSLSCLYKFRGAKYVQGTTEGIYEKCEELLKEGNKVLFTGLPCQTAGLSAYLKKNFENLIIVDSVCHGVPSPALWHKHLMELEKMHGAKIENVDFRRKHDGWKNYSIAYRYIDGEEEIIPRTQDKYLMLFLENNALRESCYRCSFKGTNRVADITIADFWGIENVCPNMYDNTRGTSLVMIHTEKGRNFFERCTSKICFMNVDYELSLAGNPAYSNSRPRSRKRDCFYNDMSHKNMDYLYKKYGVESVLQKVIRKGKKYFKAQI